MLKINKNYRILLKIKIILYEIIKKKFLQYLINKYFKKSFLNSLLKIKKKLLKILNEFTWNIKNTLKMEKAMF